MQILELVFQGISCCPELTKVEIQPGVNHLRGGAEPFPIGRLIGYSLYNESVDLPEGICLPGVEKARVLLVLQDHAGLKYRLLRDLLSGAVQLLGYRVEANAFVPITSEARQVGQYLRGQGRLAGQDLFQDLLLFSGSQLPSQLRLSEEEEGIDPNSEGISIVASARANNRGSPSDYSSNDPFHRISIEEKKRKLAALKSQKSLIESAEELQFQIDGKERSLFELEERLTEEADLTRERKRLDAALDDEFLPDIDSDQVEKQLAGYRSFVSSFDRTMDKLDDERALLDAECWVSPQKPLQNPFFAGAIAAVVGFFFAGILFDSLSWLLFVNPLPLGIIGYFLFNWIDRLENLAFLAEKIKALEERVFDEKAQFKSKSEALTSLLAQFGVQTPDELQNIILARRALVEEHKRISQAIQKFRTEVDYSSVKARHDELKKEVGELESRLKGLGVEGINTGQVIADIELLERSMKAPVDEEAPVEKVAPVVTQYMREVIDPSPVLLGRLEDALLVSRDIVARNLEDRVGQFARVLTQNKIKSISFQGKGGSILFRRVDGAEGHWNSLGVGEQDLVFIAIRLAFLESFLKQSPQPVILESPFDSLQDDAVKSLIQKILAHLASFARIVHYSTDPYWARHSDKTLELG